MPTGKVRNVRGTVTYVRGAMRAGTIAGAVIGAVCMARPEIIMTGAHTVVRAVVARRTVVVDIAAVMTRAYTVVGTMVA